MHFPSKTNPSKFGCFFQWKWLQIVININYKSTNDKSLHAQQNTHICILPIYFKLCGLRILTVTMLTVSVLLFTECSGSSFSQYTDTTDVGRCC